MPRKPAHPLLQVLFEPWPEPEDGTRQRDGYEAFAGTYYLDALDENGAFKVRGFRAQVHGCTTCRRAVADERVHWPDLNDLKPNAPRRRCPHWKTVEAIVKSFGGWKRAQYVELPENEGLHYQPIPQRRRVIEPCTACGGTGYAGWDSDMKNFLKCEAGCGSYGYGTKGQVQITYEGPVRPDRHGMTPEQRRMRV